MVEILSSLAILAVLVSAMLVFIPAFVSWTKQTSDKQTLAVLNDALNRYKTQGGGTVGLTSEAPIVHVLARLQSQISWAGITHQVLQSGKTYIGRSIDSKGDGAQYRFTRYNTYIEETGGSSPEAPPAAPTVYATVRTNSNAAAYSSDGIIWGAATLPSTGNWSILAGGSGIFVAGIPGSTTIAYSSTGTVWQTASSPPIVGSRIVYGGGKFVTIPSSSSATAYYSSDGNFWGTTTLPYTTTWDKLVYVNNTFIVLGSSNKLAYSSDGVSWSGVTLPINIGGTGVGYGGGRYVMLGYSGVAYSSNLIFWSTNTLPRSLKGNLLGYTASCFSVVDDNDSCEILYSTDGITWFATSGAICGYENQLVVGGGMFVSTGNNNSTIAYSTDGINWLAAGGADMYNSRSLSYVNGIFYVTRSNALSLNYSSSCYGHSSGVVMPAASQTKPRKFSVFFS